MKLLRIMMGRKCLSSALTAAMGSPSERCGTCSVCLRAAKHQSRRLCHTPPLQSMRQRDLNLWLLKTTRSRIAREKHLSQEKVLPKRVMVLAAQAGQLTAAGMDPNDWERMQSALDGVQRRKPY